MQYKIFTIDLHDNSDSLSVLNSFISANRIININKNLVNDQDKYYWTFLVEYVKKTVDNQTSTDSKKPKVDYKEVLSPGDFIIFSKLRDIRKKIAECHGVPVYSVFTNEQLAEIVKQKINTKNGLISIQGIGEQKIQNYSANVLDFMKSLEQLNETNKPSV